MVVFQVFENAEYFTTLLRQFKNNCFHPGIGFMLIPVKTIFIIVFLAEVGPIAVLSSHDLAK